MQLNLNQLLVGLLCSGAISLVSRTLRFLTVGGALAQFLLGWILLGLGGWQWTVPILFFFVSSSALSLVGRRRKVEIEKQFAKTGSRDASQVAANGGILAFLVALNTLAPSPVWYCSSLGAVAAATADTWGTEVGTLARTRPVLLTTLQRVEPGRSGAVSALGTISGVIGALLVALSGIAWLPADRLPQAFLITLFAGALGSSLDSTLGATIQARYCCTVCTKVTEKDDHCGLPGTLTHGYRWITNDVVNFLCTASAALCSWVLCMPLF
jgi:uncharacterized protein (TIGR00297 family)